MNETAHQNLHCDTQLNVTFGVIILTLLIALMAVSVSIRTSAERKYNKVAAMFVHNMATKFIELQFKPLEHALNETGNIIDNQNMDDFLSQKNTPLRSSLMQTHSLMPSVRSILVADNQGRFNSIPHLPVEEDFDARERPWFLSAASRTLFVHYTDHYPSKYDDKSRTVSVSRPLINKEGFFLGTLAMDVDLEQMSYPLRQLMSPLKGEFYLVDRAGDILLHSDVGNLFRHHVDNGLIEQMTNGADHLFDAKRQTHIYYYSFSNPDWFIIYAISDARFKEASSSESYQLQITVIGCLLVCLLCWWSLRHVLNKMIFEIIALMRTGRIHSGKPGDQLRQEIQSGHRQMQEAVEASNTDALTGLFNRRCFDKALDDQLIAGRPFCLGLIDLDNFKSINDTHGHPVGDDVLRVVAQEGRQIAGQEATLYRYGGEELAIIIPGEDSATALTLLEQWRTQVARRPWREPGLVVTFSAGLGLQRWRQESADGLGLWRQESAEQLLARVDQALYQAKDAGKNRVHYAD
ncbi:diguanylate cyclase [Aeromonas sp. MaB10011B]|uniref:sensor domain-containing diguanylate cyclase n=1 Tax=Aeromonas TaxID=642 RepID=UPI001B32F643|nr:MULTISPECIES: sensor domain-containing diguanylate cyclase [Aeromonas]MBP4068787.1 diguanylate cyclase [Aeromonas sp. MaB10011B]MBP4078252.1 diguanylate cyclase [Aeromonas sp. MrichA-1]